jgi:4a-hydroxytetrahydrobiopterin dehydratase
MARKRTAAKGRTRSPATRRTTARARAAKPKVDVPGGWAVVNRGKAMEVEVKTKDFLDALDVMNEVGRIAEQIEHHPDLHLEQYNHLRILTYSHDVGKLTDRDERLAARVSDVLAKRGLLPR